MTTKRIDTDYYFNAAIAFSCNDLYPEEVYQEINRLYKDKFVDAYLISLESVARTLQGSKEVVLQANRQNPKFQLIQDTMSEMQDWHCFQPEPSSRNRKELPLKGKIANPYSLFNKQESVTVGVKIGRNDPCACGSGLKHKKCCGK